MRWCWVLFLATGVAALACDNTVQVGERRNEPGPDAAVVVPEDALGDAATAAWEWRIQSPSVPCSIHALAETFTSDLFIGCGGGRLYRFDGVNAELAYQTDENKTFNLLWASPEGHVLAVAQTSRDANVRSELHRFDGTTWSKLPSVGSGAIRTLDGITANDAWLATDSEIFHFDGTSWTLSKQVDTGNVRDCRFESATRGYCVGTQGLALEWNGTEWKPLANVPWSSQAEVLGLDFEGITTKRAMFAYAEPESFQDGDHACRAARLQNGTFTKLTSEIPCFVSSWLARKRVGRAVVGGPVYWLVAHDPFGGGLVLDESGDQWRRLCGPALAFSKGPANTRVGGRNGFLGTVVGKGSDQIAIDAFGGSDRDFKDLSVAPGGAGWARTESTTACGSISDAVFRYERPETGAGNWKPVGAPQYVLSGKGFSALSLDYALTLSSGTDPNLVFYDRDGWRNLVGFGDTLVSVLDGRSETDVWLGTSRNGIGRYDGNTLTWLQQESFGRQIEQIASVSGTEAWLLARGFTADDTSMHLYHWKDGALVSEEDLGLTREAFHLSALDRDHVWLSGTPARAWDGADWKKLPFDAWQIWARTPEEVWVVQGGDILLWNGSKLERKYQGFIPISKITGSSARGIAVGAGGLTIELAAWASGTK